MTRLAVRTRRTLQPDWGEEEVSFVSCPVTGGSRTMETCKECERNAGVVHDSAGHEWVACRAERPEVAADVLAQEDPSWQTITVADAMSSDPVCIHANVELGEVVALLVENDISSAPVVDDGGRPMGMVSKSDLLMEDYERAEEEDQTAWIARRPQKKLARDIMTQGVLTISDRATMVEAVRTMVDGGVHHLPVVDAAGVLVGMLSTLDVLRALATQAGPAP